MLVQSKVKTNTQTRAQRHNLAPKPPLMDLRNARSPNIRRKPVISVSKPQPFHFFLPLKSLERYCEVLAQHSAEVNIAVVYSPGQRHLFFGGERVRTRDAFREPGWRALAPLALTGRYCAQSLFTASKSSLSLRPLLSPSVFFLVIKVR